MIITIGGKPGSGKSTIAKLLAKKLNYKHYSNGDFMREMAEGKNLSLLELSKLAETDKTIDEELDKKQIELGKIEDNLVIDSRLGFHFIPNSIKIFLEADLDIRARRILADKIRHELNTNLEEAKSNIAKRENSENKRYSGYYSINPYDTKNFNLIIDTSNLLPEQIASQILDFVNQKAL